MNHQNQEAVHQIDGNLYRVRPREAEDSLPVNDRSYDVVSENVIGHELLLHPIRSYREAVGARKRAVIGLMLSLVTVPGVVHSAWANTEELTNKLPLVNVQNDYAYTFNPIHNFIATYSGTAVVYHDGYEAVHRISSVISHVKGLI